MEACEVESVLQRVVGVPAGILGVSLAVWRAGEIASIHAVGRRSADAVAPVDVHTVFEAASLTKPLVSFIALQLAKEGRLDLASPLQSLCGPYVPEDPRAALITAAHVLTHTTGLPNIVGKETPLKTYFVPGRRFSYGSSAFAWLQRAIETITGKSLEELARERVFEPFGMGDSSLLWQERFEANHAQGQEMDGTAVPKRRPAAAGASWSLHTTAADYARFVQLALHSDGLSTDMHARWLAPAVRATRGIDDVLDECPAEEEDVAWGLGWGLEPSQACFFQWGHSPGFRAFIMGNARTKDGVVWLSNSARGLRLGRLLLSVILPGPHASMDWLRVGSTVQGP
jgi:CubicO group peptidase (beta-lactamase class C family)